VWVDRGLHGHEKYCDERNNLLKFYILIQLKPNFENRTKWACFSFIPNW